MLFKNNTENEHRNGENLLLHMYKLDFCTKWHASILFNKSSQASLLSACNTYLNFLVAHPCSRYESFN